MRKQRLGGQAVHTHDTSIKETEARGLLYVCHSGLHSEILSQDLSLPKEAILGIISIAHISSQERESWNCSEKGLQAKI